MSDLMEDIQLVNDCREILSGPDHAGYLFGKCVRKTTGRFSPVTPAHGNYLFTIKRKRYNLSGDVTKQYTKALFRMADFTLKNAIANFKLDISQKFNLYGPF